MKYDVVNRRIWFKGEILNVNDAKVNVLAPTSQFGLNVFEGIPCYWNDDEKQLYAFRLDEHYERLIRSAKLIQFDLKYTKEDFKKALIDVVKANEYDENLSPRIKCGANYINSRVGQREALRNGYDTCIFLNEVGKVAEGPGSCFFMVKGNTVITPRLTDTVLESNTRDTIIKLATEELRLKFEERTIDRTEVYMADEAFLCGSAMEVTPIFTVDRYQIGTGEQGEVTKKIHMKYLECVQGRLESRKNWITPVY